MLLVLQMAVNFVTVVLILAQCRDLDGIWDPLAEAETECLDEYVQLYFGYFQCSMSARHYPTATESLAPAIHLYTWVLD
jgi:hypothetical protein